MVTDTAAWLEVGSQGQRLTLASEPDRNPPRVSRCRPRWTSLARICSNLLGMVLAHLFSLALPIPLSPWSLDPPVPDRPALHDQQAQL